VTTPTIALYLRSSHAYAYVAGGLSDRRAARSHSSAADLLTTLAAESVTLVVLEAADERGRSNASVVAAVRSRHERVPILVVCSLEGGQSELVLQVVRAGATGLLFRGVDESRHAISAAIQHAQRNSISQCIYDELAALLPLSATPLLRYAISCAGDEPSVKQAARDIGVDRKTLFNWLRRSRGMSPREFLNWVRLTIAVGTLENTGRSAEQVALEIGFASGTAFRNMLHRYTGETSSQIRAHGGFSRTLARLKERLAPDLFPILRSLSPPGAAEIRRRHA
jgi:AraC-like DNA-binding protein